MKSSGQLLTVIGIAIAIYSLFFMEVSVDVGDGTRVNNIGLMAQQQNYILIAIVLFLAGVIISVFSRKKTLPDIDYSKIESTKSDYFICEKNGVASIDLLAIDRFSIMLLKKHNKSSVNDIELMNLPLIDRLERDLPESIRKDFKSSLRRRLKENS
ncbi:TPA: hypothetical protein MCT97_002801 [Klebsiella pneumoniae]|nr:hypothetical protein [Klebsiella pneumoniae]HBU2592503.1 hypothetical protein [Klebsiella pneumoniae]HBU2775075.1 hypothetical protein [Klebsiella pneumoniae]